MLLKLLTFAAIVVLGGTSTVPSYRAAIIEHETVYATNTITNTAQALQIINANLDILQTSIANATSLGADIVLLSEMALTSLNFDRKQMSYYLESIPKPNQGNDSTPCNNNDFSDSPTLQRLSCMAVFNKIYLSVNWGDIVLCDAHTDPNCPSDGHYQYNTQVVFNRIGEIIAKYYKIHTFNATEFDTPVQGIFCPVHRTPSDFQQRVSLQTQTHLIWTN